METPRAGRRRRARPQGDGERAMARAAAEADPRPGTTLRPGTALRPGRPSTDAALRVVAPKVRTASSRGSSRVRFR